MFEKTNNRLKSCTLESSNNKFGQINLQQTYKLRLEMITSYFEETDGFM